MHGGLNDLHGGTYAAFVRINVDVDKKSERACILLLVLMVNVTDR